MELSENWRIETDDNNVVLVFHEPRIRVKKIDGSKEGYIHEEKRYYPSLPLALKAYVRRSLNKSKEISDIFNKLEQINNKIDTLCSTK